VKKRSSRSLPNTSTFVPNVRSQCLYCVLPIMRCAFGARLDVGNTERSTPCRFVEKLFSRQLKSYVDSSKIHTFLFPTYGKMPLFDEKDPLVANTQLNYLGPKRLSRTVAHLLLMVDPLVGTNSHQCLWASLYSRANQLQQISLFNF